MEIDVIGAGVTGLATAEVFRRMGHRVRVYDLDADRQSRARELGYPPIEDEAAEVKFFCVPEWNLEQALEEASDNGTWIVRSTTRPGDIRAFQDAYCRHIVHLPEFLREATALSDALTPDRIVIGECCADHGDTVAELVAPLMCPIIRVDSVTSEMIKLVSNAHLSMLISFWNEVHQICESLEVNSMLVGRAASLDQRISPYGALMHGKPFGGFCLPKDLDSLINIAELQSLQPVLLGSIRQVNLGLLDNSKTESVYDRKVHI